MTKYKLVNPLILGNIKTDYSGKDIDTVAADAWNSISKHVTGNVPRFGFTLKNDENDQLFHYMVKEKVSNNKIIDYSIEKMDINLTKNQEDKFINHINKLNKNIDKQMGGGSKKRYKDDDSSSSSSSSSSSDSDKLYDKLSFYKSKNKSLQYWWYNPMIYTIYGSSYNSIYIPTFSVPNYPYIEIDVSSAFFN